MVKVAIMTDSNSGITQLMGKQLGIEVLPMPFVIDGVNYYEDINLSQQDFYRILGEESEISTSQPSPGIVTETWDRLLESYDEVVYIPMSSALSTSCYTAKMLADDYDGKVEVVDNRRISVTMYQSVLDAIELAKRGKTAAQIREILESTSSEQTIYIMLDTLKYLKAGGRVTPAAATVATVLRIKPVLQIQGDKLDAFKKCRTVQDAYKSMIEACRRDVDSRLGGDKGSRVFVAYSDNLEEAEKFRALVGKEFPDREIYSVPLSLSIACHIGPGAIAIAATKNLF